MNAALKHYLNPLHLYCRLRDLGVAKDLAIHLCRFYERAIFKYFLVKKCKITNSKRFSKALSSLFLVGVICFYPTILSSQVIRITANTNKITYPSGNISQQYQPISLDEPYCVETVSRNCHEEILEKEENSGFIPEKIVPKYLREILEAYYKGPSFVNEERVFKRVIKWKEDFQNIARNYDFETRSLTLLKVPRLMAF